MHPRASFFLAKPSISGRDHKVPSGEERLLFRVIYMIPYTLGKFDLVVYPMSCVENVTAKASLGTIRYSARPYSRGYFGLPHRSGVTRSGRYRQPPHRSELFQRHNKIPISKCFEVILQFGMTFTMYLGS